MGVTVSKVIFLPLAARAPFVPLQGDVRSQGCPAVDTIGVFYVGNLLLTRMTKIHFTRIVQVAIAMETRPGIKRSNMV